MSESTKAKGPPIRKGDAARTVPHDPLVEQALIGSLLLNPEAIIAAEPLLAPGDLFTSAARTIFEAAVALYKEGVVVNMTTLRHRLEAEGTFEDLGGEQAFRAAIAEERSCELPAVESYAKIIGDYAVNRRLVSAAGQIGTAAFEHTTENAASKAYSLVMEATTRKNGDAPKPLADIVTAWEENTEPLLGLATGIADLDDLTGGLHDGEIWTIAASPGTGKTAFVSQICAHVALHKAPVGFFSLEMSKQQVLMRLLSAQAGINIQAVYRNQLDDNERQLVIAAAQHLKTLPIHIDDSGGLPVEQLRSRALRLHHMSGLRLVVVDYLQLLRTEERRGSKNDEVGFISQTLTQMAKELSCPILCVSQLNRNFAHRKDRRPELSDLRDSGQIEQDAHVVCFLHREDEEDGPPSDEVELIVAKQRNGPTGARTISFDRTCGRFGDGAADVF